MNTSKISISEKRKEKVNIFFSRNKNGLLAVFLFFASWMLWAFTLTIALDFFLFVNTSIDQKVVKELTEGNLENSLLFNIVFWLTGLFQMSIVILKLLLNTLSKI